MAAKIFAGAFLLATALNAFSAELQFPILITAKQSYTNVLVTRQTGTHLFITYDGGMAAVKIADLDPTIRTNLGKAPVDKSDVMTPLSPQTAGASPAEGDLVEPMSEITFGEPSPLLRNFIAIFGWILVAVLGLTILQYPFFCAACKRLCLDAGEPSYVLVWLPGFKRWALYRATGFSWLMIIVGLVLPPVEFVMWIMCCARLAILEERSRWWAAIMIWPLIGWPMFMWLAWGAKPAAKEEVVFRDLKPGEA